MPTFRPLALAALAGAALLAACNDAPGPTAVAAAPTGAISDGAHGSGNQHFYFLRPMVTPPVSFTGDFDPTLAPEVKICRLENDACAGADVAAFSTTTGSGASRVRVEPGDQQYVVNWRTGDLAAGATYRVRVFVGATQLGFADVVVGATARELRSLNTSENIALVDGRTLPVKFRIERGAVDPQERDVPLVGAGGVHSCAIAPGGQAFCWGESYYGQLGDGTVQGDAQPQPVPVAGGHTFTQLTTGTFHTCALTPAGAAWCWGANGTGALGNGTRDNSAVPTPVAGGLAFARIAAGAFHTCGVTTSGVAYCWGTGAYGQLGNGQSGGDEFLDGVTTPVAVLGGVTFRSITVGTWHSCGLAENGQAYCWGLDWDGLLAIGGTPGQYSIQTAPVAVQQGGLAFASLATGGTSTTCGITDAGATYCWGAMPGTGGPQASAYTPTPVAGGIAFDMIAIGSSHLCGVARDSGTAWCWGFNMYGQLGNGTVTPYPAIGATAPTLVLGGQAYRSIAVGAGHSCAVTTAGAAQCWGGNETGAVGGPLATTVTSPVTVFGSAGL